MAVMSFGRSCVQKRKFGQPPTCSKFKWFNWSRLPVLLDELVNPILELRTLHIQDSRPRVGKLERARRSTGLGAGREPVLDGLHDARAIRTRDPRIRSRGVAESHGARGFPRGGTWLRPTRPCPAPPVRLTSEVQKSGRLNERMFKFRTFWIRFFDPQTHKDLDPSTSEYKQGCVFRQLLMIVMPLSIGTVAAWRIC